MENPDNLFCCRLNKDEIAHLHSFWSGKFGDFVHSSFKFDIKKIKVNKAKNFVNTTLQVMTILSIGAILMVISSYSVSLIVTVVSLCVGSFFVVYALLLLYLEVLKKWKTS